MAPFRYRKPGYVALNVTNLDRSIAFYCDLVGLQLEERHGDDVAFLRCSSDHHNLVLYRSAEAGLKRMCFELASSEDMKNATQHIKSLGWNMQILTSAESDALAQGETIRFRIPECDLEFEFYAVIKKTTTPYRQTVAKIQRLGHVVVGSKDKSTLLEMLTQKLNFRVSDHFADEVTFLRCFPNPYHHSFGVNRAAIDKFHHLNFMVSDVDDIGRAMNRMKKNNVEIVYGPGRHDISNSIFLYFLDPDGLTVEYSFGMEEFGEEDARDPRNLPMLPEILDCWGGAPAVGFGKTGIIEKASH